MISKAGQTEHQADSDFFAVGIHGDLTKQAFAHRDAPDEFRCDGGCLELLAAVQRLADSRDANGDKCDGRLYLHHIAPPNGYATTAHAEVLKGLNITEFREATIDEFVALSEKRAFEKITEIILASGGLLSNQGAGNILYLLATLLHAHQDFKHREGNWFHSTDEPITSLDHFTVEWHQSVTDVSPNSEMRERAIGRTAAFLARFISAVKTGLGEENAPYLTGALWVIGAFRLQPGLSAEDYRPDKTVMDFVFPVYETR